jgi:hypothetical protein
MKKILLSVFSPQFNSTPLKFRRKIYKETQNSLIKAKRSFFFKETTFSSIVPNTPKNICRQANPVLDPFFEP